MRTDRREIRTPLIHSHPDREVLMEMPEEHRLEAEWEMPGEHRSAVAPEVLEAAHSEVEWEMPEEHHLAVAPGNTMDSLDTMECHR